jgi:membrane protein implicated in regulation of membrane protease activity
VSGLLLAAPVYFLARFLFGQQATSESRSQDLVGRVGRVVVAIPAGGVGQVRCTIGEELVDKIARGREPQAIAENTPVIVEEVVGETVVVRPR